MGNYTDKEIIETITQYRAGESVKDYSAGFDLCYNYFQNNRYHLAGENLESSCMQLWGYLNCRFGICPYFHSPAFLVDLVNYISSISESEIWDIDIDTYSKGDNMATILDVFNNISAVLKESIRPFKEKDPARLYPSKTSTVSKIMFGVFGGIPAYGDAYLSYFFDDKELFKHLNEQSLLALENFYSEYREVFDGTKIYTFDINGNTTQRLYPKARLLYLYTSIRGSQIERDRIKELMEKSQNKKNE